MTKKSVEAKNQEVFENWGSMTYFKTVSPGKKWVFALMDEILSGIDTNSIKKVLDVGCGIGDRTYYMSTKLPKAKTVGTDFSKPGIDIAKKTYKNIDDLSFICIKADDDEIYSKKYDMICSFEVLEHIDDWKTVVDKFAAASNKYILLSFPTGRMRKFEPIMAGHVRNFKKKEMESYLSKHGFKPKRVFYAGFPFFNPIGRDMSQLFYKYRYKNILKAEKATPVTNSYSHIVYFLLRYCSTKNRFGNQFLGLFEKE